MERIGKSTYAQNKKFAIEQTTRFIHDLSLCLNPSFAKGLFEPPKVRGVKSIKKDDVADAFLQGYYALWMQLNQCVVEPSKKPAKKKAVPKKSLDYELSEEPSKKRKRPTNK